MKAFSIIVFVVGTMANGAWADNSCVPDSFCTDKINELVHVFEQKCIAFYLNAPKDTFALEATAKEEFSYLSQKLSRQWRTGFGNTCGGPIAQDACFQSCKKNGIAELCLDVCTRF